MSNCTKLLDVLYKKKERFVYSVKHIQYPKTYYILDMLRLWYTCLDITLMQSEIIDLILSNG